MASASSTSAASISSGLPDGDRQYRAESSTDIPGDTSAVSDVRPEDFDSGRVWVAFEVAAVVVFLGCLGVLAAVLLADVIVSVNDPSEVPAGYHFVVVVGADGAESTVVDCPPVAEAVGGPTDAFCDQDTRRAETFGLVTAGVASACATLFVAARRRRQWLRCERARLAQAEELVTYRQDSMPWSYWLAFVLVGGFGALNVAVLIGGLVDDWREVNPRGGIVWAGITYTALWVYGRRRAYELSIVDEDLEWRAPLKTERYPLAVVSRAEVRREGVINERRAVLHLATGEELSVVVTNGRHERRFRAFGDAVARRSSSFESGVPEQ